MNFDLWENVLWYTTYKKHYIPKSFLPDRVLKTKVIEKFIINKFLETWIIRNDDDPIDILDDMILRYSLWENVAFENKNSDLINIYSIYIKTLSDIKRYIQKETGC